MTNADPAPQLAKAQEIGGFYDADRVRKADAGHRNADREAIGVDQTETARRLRPFARRALSTLRPPLVFMRARKP